MRKPFTDLFGIGDIFRSIVELIKHISTNADRKVQRESQRLKNTEQALRNLRLGLQYVDELMHRGRKFGTQPETIHDFITTITYHAEAVHSSCDPTAANLLDTCPGSHPAKFLAISEKTFTRKKR